MAKDGTMRGGARMASGKKRKALADKLSDGQTNIKVLPMAEFPAPEAPTAAEMPPVKEWMKGIQKTDGEELSAGEVQSEIWEWLKSCGAEKIVPRFMLDEFVMSMARYIQCEMAVTKYGMLSKHPTTGNAIQSPFVAMSQAYIRQVNQAWFQIFQIVKENCSVDFSEQDPKDDMMERLLRRVK